MEKLDLVCMRYFCVESVQSCSMKQVKMRGTNTRELFPWENADENDVYEECLESWLGSLLTVS